MLIFVSILFLFRYKLWSVGFTNQGYREGMTRLPIGSGSRVHLLFLESIGVYFPKISLSFSIYMFAIILFSLP